MVPSAVAIQASCGIEPGHASIMKALLHDLRLLASDQLQDIYAVQGPEGEWVRVEEITLSYVVVHIWDDRRLVLPLSHFFEKPFQNWTRSSAALTGSVLLWIDSLFDVEAARAALKPIIEGSSVWDRRFWNLQVSDTCEKCMQLRVLATSVDSSRSWDLRCEICEKLLAYIKHTHPESLHRLRGEILESAAAPARSAN